MNHEEERVRSVLAKYQDALNASDTTAVMSLYAPDGVFMPQHFPSSIGSDAVRKAYDAVFQAIQLTVVFTIAEVQQIAPDWAIARTNSAGTVKIHATGQSNPEVNQEVNQEANQELFVFKQNRGAWQIARYCFSTTNPPRA